MAFNSFSYLFFLAVVVSAYYALSHRYQKMLLLAASYFFYGMWDYRFLSLLMLSTGIDYLASWQIARSESESGRKRWLIVSLAVNLGALGIFKYFNFFAENFVTLMRTMGLAGSYVPVSIILPVGISFYTFQTLSYTIDVYHGDCKPSKSLLDFAAYVAFFPQLVAGPIERAIQLLPQFQRQRSFEPNQFLDGLWLISLGLFKKVVIADRCAMIVNAGFEGECLPEGFVSWLVVYAFAIQLYGDFSGYSDIARGSAKLMGFELMLNFRMPYLASNPSDFWRNWHISLSTWLRDYIYIPLGGNRQGRRTTHRNLMITMLLGGLWHGAGWAFLLFGLYHGILLVVHRLLRPPLESLGKLFAGTWFTRWTWTALTVVSYFHLFCLSLLLFRTGSIDPNVSQVDFLLGSLRSITTPGQGDVYWEAARMVLPCGLIVFLLQLTYERLEAFHVWPLVAQAVGLTVILSTIVALGVSESVQFIYFQF